MKGCFAYNRIMFGIASGPLTWGKGRGTTHEILAISAEREVFGHGVFRRRPNYWDSGSRRVQEPLIYENHVTLGSSGFQAGMGKGLPWYHTSVDRRPKLQSTCECVHFALQFPRINLQSWSSMRGTSYHPMASHRGNWLDPLRVWANGSPGLSPSSNHS